MHDLLVALIFFPLVASPAIAASLPMLKFGARKSRTNGTNLPFPTPSTSR
jgi:hypothetical protein